MCLYRWPKTKRKQVSQVEQNPGYYKEGVPAADA
jgi:hypothetical protein